MGNSFLKKDSGKIPVKKINKYVVNRLWIERYIDTVLENCPLLP